MAGVVLIGRDEDAILSMKPLYTTLQVGNTKSAMFIANDVSSSSWLDKHCTSPR
jgi:hypothetical protein